MVTTRKQFGEEYVLLSDEEFDQHGLEQLFLDLKNLLSAASEAGFSEPRVIFSPITDSDGYTSNIRAEVYGESPLTEEELSTRNQELFIQSLSEKLGVSYYEAFVFYRLEKLKKVKLV
jgi:hypothetical protein